MSISATFLSTSALRQQGLSKTDVARLVASGALIRARQGRYLHANLPATVVAAARLGVRLDCISLLELWGIFVLDGSHLHVQAEVGASRLPPRPAKVVCHWRVSVAESEDLCTTLVEALTQACLCQPPRAAIATLDNAWHLGLIDEAGISEVFARLPRRLQSLRRLLNPRSESGAETILRLLLRGLGCHVQIQVKIAGVGRVDFVVDGWLIIECDSRAHHEGWAMQKRDRERDLAAAALGYTTIRPIAEDLFGRPGYILEQVRRALATRAT